MAPVIYHDSIWKKDEKPEHAKIDESFRIGPPYLFWMDTLCVPTFDKALRVIAIQGMRAVYNRANRVLVLDSDLLGAQGTATTLSSEEVLARISASTWVRRYWTLQEGLLAKNLYFQFAEDAFQISSPSNMNENILLHHFDNEVAYYANSTDFRMRSRSSITTTSQRVRDIWSSLENRVASHSNDEPLCIATLLDMDVGQLLDPELPGGRRAERLWGMYKAIPLGVLCTPAEKLLPPAPPWALAHMKDCTRAIPPTSVAAHQIHGKLSFSHHGLIVTDQLKRQPVGLFAVVAENDTYYIRKNVKNGNKSWNSLDLVSPHARLGIVFGQDGLERISGCVGALISLTEGHWNRGRVMKGHYLTAVSIIMEGGFFDEAANPPWTEAEIHEKELVYAAQWTPARQEWEVSA